jgi:hypothetical protein
MRYLLIVAFLVVAVNARANADSYSAELDRLAAKNDWNELMMRVNQPRNADEFRVGLEWLRNKSRSAFGGSRIHYSYALGLQRAGVKETSIFAYLLGLLTGRTDAARCKDPSAPGDKLHRWETSVAPIFQQFVALESVERRRLLALAVEIEERFSARPPDSWLCSGGLAFALRFAEKHKNHPNPPVREIQDPARPGRTIVLEDPDFKPEFVADEEWLARRRTIVADFIEQLSAAR